MLMHCFYYSYHVLMGHINTENFSKSVDLMKKASSKSFLSAMYNITVVKRAFGSSHHVEHRSLKDLFLFCELSFLFDSAYQAWKAIQHKDYEFALRIYQHLADQGSEAAMWNSERLSEDLRRNSTDWFMLQVAMGFYTALYSLGEKKYQKGEIESAKKLWKEVAYKEPHAAFRYAWVCRNNFSESLKYLKLTLLKRSKSFLIIYPTIFIVFILNIPSFFINGIPEEISVFAIQHINIILCCICFCILFIFISCRLKMLI